MESNVATGVFQVLHLVQGMTYDLFDQKVLTILYSTDAETIFDRFRKYVRPIQKLFSTDSGRKWVLNRSCSIGRK